MPRLITIVLSTTLFVLSLSCSDKPTPPEPPEPEYGQVVGKVTDASTKNAIPNAKVTCDDKFIRTDDAGLYSFSRIPVGAQRLQAESDRYETYSTFVNVKVDEPALMDIELEPLPPLPPETTFVRLLAIADTYIDGSPDWKSENYGSSRYLNTGTEFHGSAPESIYWGFVKFDVSTIPVEAEILDAQLFLVDAYNSTPLPVDIVASVTVYQVLYTNWTELGLTYQNSPSVHGYLTVHDVLFDYRDSEHRFDVTPAVESWVAGDTPNYGLSIKARNILQNGEPTTDGCTFLSRDAGAAAVMLEIRYVTTP